MLIRHPLPHDLPGIYRVCLETGDAGSDATELHRNPDLLGHVYAGAHATRHPEHGFVVVDERGVAGYVLAVPDTRAFEAWQEESWYPALREQYPLDSIADDRLTPADAQLIRLLHDPERRAEAVLDRWPAHLHIDVLPRLQRTGLGRRLIGLALDALRDAGVSGLHLAVDPRNSGAAAFYPKVGLTRFDTPDDPDVLLFTQDL